MASMSDDRPTRPAGWDCRHNRSMCLADSMVTSRCSRSNQHYPRRYEVNRAFETQCALFTGRFPIPNQPPDWKPPHPDPKLYPRLSWSFESKEHTQPQRDSAIYSTLSPSSWIGGLNKAPIIDAASWFLAPSTCEYTFSVTEASRRPSSP